MFTGSDHPGECETNENFYAVIHRLSGPSGSYKHKLWHKRVLQKYRNDMLRGLRITFINLFSNKGLRVLLQEATKYKIALQ